MYTCANIDLHLQWEQPMLEGRGCFFKAFFFCEKVIHNVHSARWDLGQVKIIGGRPWPVGSFGFFKECVHMCNLPFIILQFWRIAGRLHTGMLVLEHLGALASFYYSSMCFSIMRQRNPTLLFFHLCIRSTSSWYDCCSENLCSVKCFGKHCACFGLDLTTRV